METIYDVTIAIDVEGQPDAQYCTERTSASEIIKCLERLIQAIKDDTLYGCDLSIRA